MTACAADNPPPPAHVEQGPTLRDPRDAPHARSTQCRGAGAQPLGATHPAAAGGTITSGGGAGGARPTFGDLPRE
eukprot:gene21832-28121_t